jgi:Pathogenicity locus
MADSFKKRDRRWCFHGPMNAQHRPSASANRANRSDPLGLANVGPAVARYLARVGITERRQLVGRDPVELFHQLCAADGQPYDPCLLDTFMSAVDQAEGGPARPWWHYTPERKRMLAASSSQPAVAEAVLKQS